GARHSIMGTRSRDPPETAHGLRSDLLAPHPPHGRRARRGRPARPRAAASLHARRRRPGVRRPAAPPWADGLGRRGNTATATRSDGRTAMPQTQEKQAPRGLNPPSQKGKGLPMSGRLRTLTPALLLAFYACGLLVSGCGPQRTVVAEQGEGTQAGSGKEPEAPVPPPAVEKRGAGPSPDVGQGKTVLFLVDRSLSVPPEPSPDDPTSALRWLREKRFVNEAVEKRGSGDERDKAGLIVFGRRPRLELPPSDAPRFKFQEYASTVDGTATDIGAAIKLALATFPE